MTGSREQLPDLPKLRMNWTWVLAILISSALVTVVMLTVFYPTVPDPMPVHWGASGEADRFEPKSLPRFLVNFLLGPVIILLALLFTEAIMSMQSGDITGPGGAKTAKQAYRIWWGYKITSKHVGWYLFALNLMIMLLLMWSYVGRSGRFSFLFFLLAMTILTVIFIRILVREENALEKKYPREAGEPRRKWGIFYHAPNDNRVLIDTGAGSNFTFNLATRGGQIGALLLFGLPLVLVVGILLAQLTG